MVEHSNFGKGVFNQKRSLESKVVSDIFKPTISLAKKSRQYSQTLDLEDGLQQKGNFDSEPNEADKENRKGNIFRDNLRS